MINFIVKEKYSLDDLISIMRILRSEEGCPWDREQTHKSIRMNFIEEAFEACEAIDNEDPVLLKEELGDVLAQVVFHSEIEREAGRFTIDDVADGVCKKFIERHPHVFGDVSVKDSAEVLKNWDDIKRSQKGQTTHFSAMDSVARSLPSLMRAEKLQSKAEKAGLPPKDRVAAIAALKDKLSKPDIQIGDILFETVRLARTLKINPEQALDCTNERFLAAFRKLECESDENGEKISVLLSENADKL